MSTVCEALRRARLDQGIDLATVAARTKIKSKYLQAIEAGDPKSLPGGFFYKSFAHQYATFLGVDAGAIDAEIDRVLSPDAPLPSPMPAQQRDVKVSSGSRGARKYFSYAALVLILVACSGIDDWWHESRAHATEKPRAASGCGKHHAGENAKPRHRAGFTRFRFPSWSRACRGGAGGGGRLQLVPESSLL